MKKFEELVCNKFDFLFKEFNFNIIDKGKPNIFNNVYLSAELNGIILTFIRDRDEHNLYLRFSNKSKKYYYQMVDILKLFENNSFSSDFTNEEFNIHLRKNIQKIIDAFDINEIEKTIIKLKDMKLKNLA